MSNYQAQFLAFDAGLDLVELNPNHQPPIVKIIDYGKFRYEQERKQREAKSKSRGPEVKEIRLTRKIDQHDLETKARRAKDWLDHGDKVRVYLQLMGREFIFADQARDVIDTFLQLVGGAYEQEPNRMGNRIVAIIRKLR